MKNLNPKITDAELLLLAQWAQVEKAKRLADKTATSQAIAQFNGVIKVLPAGRAYGSRDPRKGYALPMQYFRQGGSC